MPKPTNKIVLEKKMPSGIDYEVQTPKAMYVLTFNGEVSYVRQDNRILNQNFKYLRNIWSDEGTAINKVKRLNAGFNTSSFGYKKV
tara:strand:+ start:4452 stop:4709 length:258 start_codon:yes stop_codon:yes gene_type:complete